MSNEQARGEDVDSRTDLFSFGAVLYEMATGQRAFAGNTTAVIFHSILSQVPTSPLQLNPALPPELERIINRLLEKDHDLRYQSAADLRSELKRLKRDTDSGRSPATAGVAETAPTGATIARPRWKIWAAVAGVAGLALVLALLYGFSHSLPPPRVVRYTQLTNDSRPKRVSNCLVTDGARLYFGEWVGEKIALAQVSTSGGETASVSTPFPNVALWDIAPDHSQLLVSSFTGLEPEVPLWTLPLPAGTPRRLGDLVGHEAAWSPDGQRIVFAQGSTLYTAKADGTETRNLTTASGLVWWPRWSPDGRRLRFSEQDPRTNSSSIWEVAADGSNLHRLLEGWNNPPGECCGNWTADGKYFVFQFTRNGVTNICALREERGLFRKRASEPAVLTAGPIDYLSPLPGLDGKKLFVIGDQPRGELMRYDKGTGQFVPYLSGLSAYGVSFSGDGKWVAYVAYPEGTLWRSRIDGRERLQLTFSPMLAYQPYWSPDGKTIAFMGRVPGKPWQVYVVVAEGGSPRLVSPEDRNHADPSWSPDGLSLAFGALPFLESDHAGGIFVLDLKTNRVSQIGGSEHVYAPHWSPDGRYIAVQTFDGLKQLLFDLKTRKWEELNSGVVMGYPNWSRDGKYLYYDLLWSEGGFYRLRISDHKVERVASLKDIRRAQGDFGAWAGVSPDDSPLLLRDSSRQEIYALDVEFP
jgi:Tol biopolymer transport system component